MAMLSGSLPAIGKNGGIAYWRLFKVGAAYLPLDPEFPQERLLYMLEDAGAVAIIEDTYRDPRDS